MALSRLVAFALVAAVGASCTLTREGVIACAERDCVSTFGAGYVCSASGLCERAVINPRCTKTFPEDLLQRSENYKNAIMLGVLMDRTVQAGREDAVQLAAQQVNAAQGLDGRPFGLVFCDIAENSKDYDSLKRPEAAKAMAKNLVDTFGVAAIIGPSASTDTLAVFDQVKTSGVLVMSPASTSPALTGYDTQAPTDQTPGLLWRTAVPDTLQGKAIAQHLMTTYPDEKSVVVVHEDGAYGASLKDVFTAAFTGSGRTVKALSFKTSQQREFAILEAPKTTPKIVLFFSSQTADASAFLNAAKANEQAGYKDVRLFLTDSGANPELLSGASGAASVFPRVIGSRPAISPTEPTFVLFKTSYNVAFKKDAADLAFVPHSYDAAWLVFFGAAWSLRQEKNITPIGVARGLRKLSATSDALPIGNPDTWTQVAESFRSGTAVNVVGASGNLDYDPTTEETSGLIDIWKVSGDGKSFESVSLIDAR